MKVEESPGVATGTLTAVSGFQASEILTTDNGNALSQQLMRLDLILVKLRKLEMLHCVLKLYHP